VNGIIPFSASSLLIQGKTTHFFMLLLYSASLLNVFISSQSLLVDFLGFSHHLQIGVI
jgi:hypothetical protein